MTLFWTLAGGLLLLSAVFLLLPLWPGRDKTAGAADDDTGITQDAVNLALYRQQLAELDADLAAGKIDPDQHQTARLELERELLHDIGDSETGTDAGQLKPAHPKRGRWLLPLLALAVPALAVVFYQATGTPEIIPRLANAGSAQIPGHGDGEMPPLDVLAERLAARMEQNPSDLEGWMMLGRTYFALGSAPQALKALERAYALAPDDLDVKLTYAEAIAANQDNSLEGKPAELISAVLAADPEHLNARWLNGVLSFQRGQYTAAIQSWQRILAQTDPNSSDAADLRGLIEEARQRGGAVGTGSPMTQTATSAQSAAPATPATAPSSAAADTSAAPAPAASTATGDSADSMGQPESTARDATAPATTDTGKAAAPMARIQARISVAPELASQVPPGAAVFVYAKAAAGPPMPLAAQRIAVGDLPATLTLDDSMAMTPAMKLSSFPEVIVGARVSRSGQAMPMSGDLQGETGPIKIDGANQNPVQVVIDQRLP